MITGMGQTRTRAPVARSVFWVMLSVVAWEFFQFIRSGTPAPEALGPYRLSICCFSCYCPPCGFCPHPAVPGSQPINAGHLNIYSIISSPLAWLFWIGLGIGMIGHGLHVAGHALRQSMPETFAQGEFAAKIAFLDSTSGYLLVGIGFFLTTLVILLIGQGAGQQIVGPIRLLFVLGSLATYGTIVIYLGVGGGQIILAIVVSAVLSAVGFWTLHPSEITRDPVGAFVVPGTFLAGVTLIVWTVIVGGRPTWP